MSDLKLLTSSHKTNIACLKCLVLHSESFPVTNTVLPRQLLFRTEDTTVHDSILEE